MDALRILRIIVALLSILFLLSCSSGGSDTVAGGGIGGTGTVVTTISDPPVCKAPIGDFANVWVTITRVRAHTSSNAGPNDSGWVDLVDLRDKPMQIDLFNLDSTNCILTVLGSTSGIPAGQYQQIRFHLLSNTPPQNEATPPSNNCGSNNGYNCVVLTGGGIETLQLSSEAQTGLKIPSGQIAGGHFTVPAGQVVDLNIDFDACASIVLQGNGKYRLKPVLHAGEISLNTTAISGRVVDSDGGASIGNAIVLIEQKDAENIDRVIMQKLTGSDGRFIFCPLPTGTYDVVVSAKNQTKTYNATITLGVGVGTAMGDIKLYPATGTGTIKGDVTTVITGSGQEVDIDISGLKYATSSLRVTIPVFQGSTPTTVTAPNGIPTNYSLSVPTGNPQVGTFNSAGTSYSPVSGGYFINAEADNCTQSSQSTTELNVGPGGEVTAPDITFTGCSGNY
ncbi:MAG: DUF4382 domain-containing protein [Syntrophaceae bacterium]|nr:DUF4382 domain-containing protein [Syntrophaceae bacterium]